jgi:hypothetical protein
MEASDKFELVREIIRHEDGLVNNRMTWYLILNGVLFNAWMGGIQILCGGKQAGSFQYIPRSELVSILILFGLLGVFLAITTRTLVLHAHRQMETAVDWWNKTPDAATLPRVRGDWSSSRFSAIFSPNSLPIFLGFIWVSCEVMLFVTYNTWR